jgi:mono/diheme cytochrome c family protein
MSRVFVLAVASLLATGVHASRASSASRATGSARQPADGAKIYAATCQACHQASGLGIANQFPPLVGSDWVTGSEERLLLIILHGLTGEIDVEGETFSGLMPTWGPSFKDDELAAVATYVRSAWGNKAAPVQAATVTRVRLSFARRDKPWTVPELQAALKR